MANFSYIVIDKYGKEKKGSLEAADKEKAIAQLKGEGMVPLEVREQSVWDKDIQISIGKGIKARDYSVLCRQFVSIIGAGVTVTDALDMLSEQTENKELAKAVKNVQIEIEKGETLSDAMKAQGKVFPVMLIQMVQAGEASGSLDISFSRMAVQFEKEAKLKGLIKKASIYPVMVAIVAFMVVIVMLVKIIPSYSEMFEQLETELPWITKAVLAASNFVIGKWYLLLLGGVIIVTALNVFRQTNTGKYLFSSWAIQIPIFGKLNVKTACSLFARTSGTLLAAGIPMLEVLDIVAHTMKNTLYRQAVLEAKDEVSKGLPLSEPLKRSGIFPAMVCHMTRIGEETGDMEGMLDKLADYYDEEVELTTQSVMAALEPLIILVLAVLVIILIAAIMAPMMAMYSGLDATTGM